MKKNEEADLKEAEKKLEQVRLNRCRTRRMRWEVESKRNINRIAVHNSSFSIIIFVTILNQYDWPAICVQVKCDFYFCKCNGYASIKFVCVCISKWIRNFFFFISVSLHSFIDFKVLTYLLKAIKVSSCHNETFSASFDSMKKKKKIQEKIHFYSHCNKLTTLNDANKTISSCYGQAKGDEMKWNWFMFFSFLLLRLVRIVFCLVVRTSIERKWSTKNEWREEKRISFWNPIGDGAHVTDVWLS